MNIKIMSLVALAAGSLGVAGAVTPAAAQPSSPIPACGALPAGATTYTCACPEVTLNASVWGSNPYTADSNLCTAAVHAGAITAAGGPISVQVIEGQEAYASTTANGVTTSDWGSYSTSITFSKTSQAVDVLAQYPACSGIPDGQTAFACTCDPADGFMGAIWGSGPYTADSDICTAARHFNAVTEEGGLVDVLVIPGLDNYSAFTFEGITSSEWGPTESAITFDLNAHTPAIIP